MEFWIDENTIDRWIDTRETYRSHAWSEKLREGEEKKRKGKSVLICIPERRDFYGKCGEIDEIHPWLFPFLPVHTAVPYCSSSPRAETNSRTRSVLSANGRLNSLVRSIPEAYFEGGWGGKDRWLEINDAFKGGEINSLGLTINLFGGIACQNVNPLFRVCSSTCTKYIL